MAAVLAAGPGAALSHQSAAALWRIWRWPDGVVHVTSPDPRRNHRGVRVHSAGPRRPRDPNVVLGGIPVTSVPQTIVDLAAVLGPAQLANVMHEAAYRGTMSVDRVRQLAESRAGTSSVATLHSALDAHLAGSAGTRSALEERFAALLVAGGIRPLPELCVPVSCGPRTFEVDAPYGGTGGSSSIDGPAHGRARTSRDDHARTTLLQAAGYTVFRITAGDLDRDPRAVLDVVRSAVA